MDVTTYAHPDVELARSTDRFIAIRVDADRRPDINDRYNLGGWPTTVFLTRPRRHAVGATYLDAAADDREPCRRLPMPIAIVRMKSARSARLRAVRALRASARNRDTLQPPRDHRALSDPFRRAIRPAQWRVWIGSKASTSPCVVVCAFAGRGWRQRAGGDDGRCDASTAARRFGTRRLGGFFRYGRPRLDPAWNREDARGQRRAVARVRRSGAATSATPNGSSRRQRSFAGSRDAMVDAAQRRILQRQRRLARIGSDDVRRQERDDGWRVHQGGGVVRRRLAARLCVEVARGGHRAGVYAGRRSGSCDRRMAAITTCATFSPIRFTSRRR